MDYTAKISFPPATEIHIKKGDTLAKFYTHLGKYEKTLMKLWLKYNSAKIPTLQEGSYLLSGNYTKPELLKHIAQGPKQEYQRITLLEWWSIYDIDAHLAGKGFIPSWAFIEQTQNQSFIAKVKTEYPFLAMLPAGKSLEGFLYPDTYFLDHNAPIVEQLINAQLKNFNEKIRKIHREDFISFSPESLPLQNYYALILASVIENEEKTHTNKPIIAWIFINRIKSGMRLDADVTLCYGLKITYDQCRNAIIPNLSDASNPYNTRKNLGLPPTPISSPSIQTLKALFTYQKTPAFYYLHDEQWKIHYANTLEEHYQNVQNYLRK